MPVEVGLVEVDAEELAERRQGLGCEEPLVEAVEDVLAREGLLERVHGHVVAGAVGVHRVQVHVPDPGLRVLGSVRRPGGAGPSGPPTRSARPGRGAGRPRPGRTSRASKPARIMASRSTGRRGVPRRDVGGQPRRRRREQPGEVVEVGLGVGQERPRAGPPCFSIRSRASLPDGRSRPSQTWYSLRNPGRTAARPRGSGASRRSRPSGTRLRAGRCPRVTGKG